VSSASICTVPGLKVCISVLSSGFFCPFGLLHGIVHAFHIFVIKYYTVQHFKNILLVIMNFNFSN
jgi:hypothetical protein